MTASAATSSGASLRGATSCTAATVTSRSRVPCTLACSCNGTGCCQQLTVAPQAEGSTQHSEPLAAASSRACTAREGLAAAAGESPTAAPLQPVAALQAEDSAKEAALRTASSLGCIFASPSDREHPALSFTHSAFAAAACISTERLAPGAGAARQDALLHVPVSAAARAC